MTPTQTYSVQGSSPFTAKDGKPKLIPEIKQKMCAGGYHNKKIKVSINNKTETGLHISIFFLISGPVRQYFQADKIL